MSMEIEPAPELHMNIPAAFVGKIWQTTKVFAVSCNLVKKARSRLEMCRRSGVNGK